MYFSKHTNSSYTSCSIFNFPKKLKLLRVHLVCNLSSLNFHQSSLKIPQFLKPPIWHLNSDLVFNFKSCGWVSPKNKKKIKEFVKHCGLVCGFNYESAIEN